MLLRSAHISRSCADFRAALTTATAMRTKRWIKDSLEDLQSSDHKHAISTTPQVHPHPQNSIYVNLTDIDQDFS
jgi:hypothetical protein